MQYVYNNGGIHHEFAWGHDLEKKCELIHTNFGDEQVRK